MSILVRNLHYRSTLKDKLSIIFLASGDQILYAYMMAKVFDEHNFFCVINEPYHWITNILEIPDNLTIVNNTNFLLYNNCDLIICNDRTNSYSNYKKLSSDLHAPLIYYEHSPPPPGARQEDITLINRTYTCEHSVSIDDGIDKSWKYQFNDIIPYFIPSLDTDEEKKEKILLVGNFAPQEYPLIKHLVDNTHIPVEVIGDNPKLSQHPTDWTSFMNSFKTSTIFICLSPPMMNSVYLNYAMSAGCKIVGFGSPLVRSIIDKSQSGVICQTIEEAAKKIPTLTVKHSQNAANYIKSNNTYDNFKTKWTKVFSQLSTRTYIR